MDGLGHLDRGAAEHPRGSAEESVAAGPGGYTARQIYPELNHLAGDGLVTVVEEGPRGRRTYAITDAGRAELRRWMRNPPEQFNVRNEFVLRLFLLSALEPEEARAALLGQLAQNDAALADLREQADKFEPSPNQAPLPR
ncbi:MAG TPA: PadR family transcriptional regulator [Streptosporangiaceae bacterium]|nr:PadR family transcriptional regulator [Streptosporangiaceae bacterium]